MKKRITIHDHREEVIAKVETLEDINFGHLSLVGNIGKFVAAAGKGHTFNKLIKAKINRNGDLVITLPKKTF